MNTLRGCLCIICDISPYVHAKGVYALCDISPYVHAKGVCVLCDISPYVHAKGVYAYCLYKIITCKVALLYNMRAL